MNKESVIAVDAGNTHFRFGVVELAEQTPVELHYATRDTFAEVIEPVLQQVGYDVLVSVATVVSEVKQWLTEELVRIGFTGELIWCRHLGSALLQNRYSETLGIDRYVDAVAATELYPNRDLVVIDSGTATTIDMVTADREFIGGYIIPGIGLKARMISEGTDKLPPIDPYKLNVTSVPDNTMDAIASGLLLDSAGGIEKAIDLAMAQLDNPLVIACGGGWEIIGPYVDRDIIVVEDLTLRGTALLGQEMYHRKDSI